MANTHYLFNTSYYAALGDEESVAFSDDKGTLKIDTSGLDEVIKSGINETICALSIGENDIVKKMGNTHSFCLKTTYPGLLVGTGYAHQAFSSSEVIKLGFSFDYVTGQPYIPSSTVKGVLRSAFMHCELIKSILKEIGVLNEESEKRFDKDACYVLSENIFGSYPNTSSQSGNAPSVRSRDVFFDAFVGEKYVSREVLGIDYITPHVSYSGEIDRSPESITEKKRGLIDPQPIKMLRILPGVTLRFEFMLRGSIEVLPDVELTADQRLALFKSILLVIGIGAKTNVGFGALEDSGTGGAAC